MTVQLLAKVFITVVLVLIASALARRTGWLGALVASLPLTSLLVLGWLYFESRDSARVAEQSLGIFWFVLGSLPFFLVLALGLRQGWHFGVALLAAAVTGALGVWLVQTLLVRFA